MFDNFTIRTSRQEKSVFPAEHGFSWAKLLSPDPTGTLCAEEFAAWGVCTLLLCFTYCAYSRVKARVLQRLSKERAVADGAKEKARSTGTA